MSYNIIRQLHNIAEQLGLWNVVVEKRENIGNGSIEFAIMGNGYISDLDILQKQDFIITAIHAIAKDELLILVKQTS